MISNRHSRRLWITAALIAGSSLMASSVFAANMDKPSYDSARKQIEADYKQARAACDAYSGNAKDVCMEQAKAKQKVALAELEYNYTGKASDMNKLAVVRADTSYDVAKEMCDDKGGNAKDVCVAEAKAVHTKALADAKANKKVGDATRDAAEDKRDADYKVAEQKCDAFAGDAKDACVKSAKSRYGKS
jgi:hypothetical protein